MYFANQLSVSFKVPVGVNEAMLNVTCGLNAPRLGDEECTWGAFKHIKEHQGGSGCWKLDPILNLAVDLTEADQILHGNCITSLRTTFAPFPATLRIRDALG